MISLGDYEKRLCKKPKNYESNQSKKSLKSKQNDKPSEKVNDKISEKVYA